jgi:WhiB family redox-sensing transcriptional regulator
MSFHWQSQAACFGKPVDWWFPSTPGDHKATERAKTICRSCPVITECLDHALEHNEKHGIWAATSEKERERMQRRRRLAA